MFAIGLAGCGKTHTGVTGTVSSSLPTASSTSTSTSTTSTTTTTLPPATVPPATAAPVVTSPAVTAAPSAPSGCYPKTNSGGCYEPGEYCRTSDHGVSGVAGDGRRITCEDNDGWRWEPS